MIKLIAIVGTNPNVLQTVNCFNTCKNILLIRLRSNWSKLKISCFNKPADKQVLKLSWILLLQKLRRLMSHYWDSRIRPLYSSGLDECSRLAHTESSHCWINQSWLLGLHTVRWDLHAPNSTSPPNAPEIKALFCQIILALSFIASLWSKWRLGGFRCHQKLDAIFDDFRVFVKITDNCCAQRQELLRKCWRIWLGKLVDRRQKRMKFVGLVGSNYDQSYNRKLLEFIRRQFKIKFGGSSWNRRSSNV